VLFGGLFVKGAVGGAAGAGAGEGRSVDVWRRAGESPHDAALSVAYDDHQPAGAPAAATGDGRGVCTVSRVRGGGAGFGQADEVLRVRKARGVGEFYAAAYRRGRGGLSSDLARWVYRGRLVRFVLRWRRFDVLG